MNQPTGPSKPVSTTSAARHCHFLLKVVATQVQLADSYARTIAVQKLVHKMQYVDRLQEFMMHSHTANPVHTIPVLKEGMKMGVRLGFDLDGMRKIPSGTLPQGSFIPQGAPAKGRGDRFPPSRDT